MRRHTQCMRRTRIGMSRIEAVVAICVIGFLMTMLAPAIQTPRRPARRMECLNNLRQIALATLNYATANQGRMPLLEDGQFGWPVDLLPYLDDAALYRTLKADSLAIDKEWQRSKRPLLRRVLSCPADVSNASQHLGLSYAANAGWGRFLADFKTEAVSETRPHSADIDWDGDGSVTEGERKLTRATGVFWRAHEDGFQLSLDDVNDGDGQATTMLFVENMNARNWLSRETFDLGFVVGLDRITFEPMQDGQLNLNVKSTNLGPFAVRSMPRVLPGRSPVPSSNHTGIFNAAFIDGRAEQVNVNIDPRVYLARMTWNGSRLGEDPKLPVQ